MKERCSIKVSLYEGENQSLAVGFVEKPKAMPWKVRSILASALVRYAATDGDLEKTIEEVSKTARRMWSDVRTGDCLPAENQTGGNASEKKSTTNE